MSAVVGSQYGATAGAAESLRAQLHSQGKLTTQRHENRKIRHENAIFTANEYAPACAQTSDLSFDTKKHTTKSRKIIPLS
jgi:hypothetical protein